MWEVDYIGKQAEQRIVDQTREIFCLGELQEVWHHI